MFSPNTGESLQDYPLATWPAQNLTRTFNCTRFAPWEIPVEALESEVVRKAITNIKNRVRNNPQTQDASEQQPIFSESY